MNGKENAVQLGCIQVQPIAVVVYLQLQINVITVISNDPNW